MIAGYTAQLKKTYKEKHYPKNVWPLFTPTKFTNLGYVIHKPRRTAQETENFAKLARSGDLSFEKSVHTCDTFDFDDSGFDTDVIIREEISDIFLTTNKRPQIILAEGAPGIGKTMFVTEIAHRWATGDILKDKIALLFFSLRDIKIKKMEHIEDMFTYSLEDKKHAEIYASYFLRNNGKGLIILVDGLDENPQNLQEGSFLYDALIEKNKFTEACIIITSRPDATVKLQQYISYRVEIIGFTSEKRQKFVKEYLKEKAEDLNNYLQSHKRIDTLCYIPLNMTIMLCLFEENVGLPNTQTELTDAAVKKTVFRFLQNVGKTTDKNDLENLPKPYDEIFYHISALAYNALAENKLTFTKDDIKKACPVSIATDDEDAERAITHGLDLMKTACFFRDRGGDTDSLSNFAHYSVQELLAARYIAFSHRSCFRQLPLKWNVQKFIQECKKYFFQLKTLKGKFWNGDYINVWSFYIGLTGGEDMAFKLFLSREMVSNYMQLRNFYKPNFLSNIKWLRLYMLQDSASWYEIVEQMDVVQCIVSKKINKIKTLALYLLLQEATDHDNKMITDLDGVITQTEVNLSEQTLSSEQDLNLLGDILSRPCLAKQWELVNLSHCNIDDEMFKILNKKLTKNDGRPKPEIKDLNLSSNKLKSCSNAIANLVCCRKVLHLDLSYNILEDMTSFGKCGDFLETLNVSNYKLDNEKALKLFYALQFLRKLKNLALSHNDIKGNKEVNNGFGLTLCSCNSLKTLKLDGNAVEFEDYAMLLFGVVIKIRDSKSNEHCYNKQSAKAHAFLEIMDYCNQLNYQPDTCTLRNKLIETKTLDISYCDLGTDAGCSLGQRLHLLVNLKALDITKNQISDKATKCLTKGMFLIPDLVEFRYYERNLFTGKSIMIFEMVNKLRTTANKSFKCDPSEVKALLFILDCINDDIKELQSGSKVVSIISNVTVLILNHNESITWDYKLTSDDFKELCGRLKLFKQLKVLDVRNNNITSTDEIKQSLTKVMLQMNTLNDVELVGNPIFDNKRSMSVFDTIRNVREKEKQVITDNCSHSVIYIMECLNELENPDCFKSFDNIITLNINAESSYADKFFEYIKFLPSLKHLRINNAANITDIGIYKLGEYLCQNKALTTLDLSSCNLEKLDIIKCPPSDRIPLKVVKLNNSSITHEVLLNLSLNMLMFADLDELDLGGNRFGDKAISNLHNALINCKSDQLSMTVTTLILANNGLTSSSAVKIVEIVEKCKVKHLNISNNNRLGNIFCQFEKFTITTLEELNVSNTHSDVGQFAKNLNYLKSCSSLKKLDISNNGIDETAIREIYYTFVECLHLEEVICDKNPAKYEIEVAFYFIKSLHNSTHENTFKCPPSKIKAVIHLLRSIQDNKQKLQSSDLVHRMSFITELNLSHSDKTTLEYKLTSQDFKELCGALAWFKHLKVLDVRNNNITEEITQTLTKIMLQISALNTVKLIGNPIIDDDFSTSVFDTIKYLREGKIQSIDDSQNSFDKFSHFIIYIMECLNELENPDCFKSFDNIITLDIDSESNYVGKFFECIKFLTSLKSLKINNAANITDIGINKLGEYLCQNKALTTLDLSSCNLEKLDIIKCPPSDRIPLKVVKLNNSSITHEVLLNLSLNMLMFADLDELDLGGNRFGDKAISNLHNALINCKSDQLSMTVTTLILANNGLTSSSAVKIVEIVEKCKVKHLNISNNNRLGNIFCQFEKFTITTLEELNVSNTHSDVGQFAKNLNYLKSCSSLKKLDISNNGIDETAIREIYYTFVECLHLEEVICDKNPAKYEIEVAFYFIKSLHNSTHENTFKCPPSKIKAVIHLLRSIQDNKQKLQSSDLVHRMSFITELNLSHSDKTTLEYKLTSQDFKELCGALAWFKHLKVLDVRNNNITEEITQTLTKIMLQISALNTVKLIGNPIIDDDFSTSVFDTIKYLREGKIQSIDDSQNSFDKFSHFIIYIMECLNELENPDCFKSFDNIITLDIDSESNYVGKFFECIKFLTSLKSLKINNAANITDIGINKLGEYLCQNKALTTLDLSSCNLEKLDIKCPPSDRIPLKVVKLNNSSITPEVLLNLSLNMLMFADLDELDLGGNRFGDKAISNLHNALINCKSDQLSMTVTTLILANNRLTSSSAVKIVEIVEKCKVKHLNIFKNDLVSIFSHFEKNMIVMLEELNISANNNSIDTTKQFLENISLKSCGSLKKLDISGNNIDETAKDEIHDFSMKCIHLKEVVCTKNAAENDIKTAFELVQNLQYQPSCVKMINFKGLPKASFTFITNSLVTFQVGQITSFDFSNNDMKIDENFTFFLQNCTEVKVLNLENNNITDEAHKYLATGFLFTSNLKISNLHLEGNPCMINRKNKSVLKLIETLRLSISEFECPPKKFEILLTVLELLHSVDGKPNDVAKTISLIKTLNISYSNLFKRQIDYTSQLQSRDIESFCKYLNYFKSLESINMNGNNIKEDVKDNLAIAILENYKIIEIHLEGNPIHKVLQCRKLFETIGELRRKVNEISFKDAPQTLEALVSILHYVNGFSDRTCDITKKIEHLDISSFFQLPHYKRRYGIETTNKPKEISAGLIHHLILFRKLKTLNMRNACLTPRSLAGLSRFLCNNNTLQCLDISCNDIQAEGALIILKSLNTNTTLKKLNLSNNNITGEKHKEVTRIISRLSIEVDMSGNEPIKVSKKFVKSKSYS